MIRTGLDASWTRRRSDWKDMLPVAEAQDYYSRPRSGGGWRYPGDICPCCGAEVPKLYQHKKVCERWPK